MQQRQPSEYSRLEKPQRGAVPARHTTGGLQNRGFYRSARIPGLSPWRRRPVSGDCLGGQLPCGSYSQWLHLLIPHHSLREVSGATALRSARKREMSYCESARRPQLQQVSDVEPRRIRKPKGDADHLSGLPNFSLQRGQRLRNFQLKIIANVRHMQIA